MIVRIEGKVVGFNGVNAVIDCQGVGYGVTVLHDDQARMPVGQVGVLHITEVIKEDAHDLYGFLAYSAKELFELLISVNGVGPKAGMAILNVASENMIRQAIAEGNTALLARASGVGKKVAERVVVDLKNKVGLVVGEDATDFIATGELSDTDDAVQALVALGYTLPDAKQILARIDRELPLPERVAIALRGGA